MTLTGFLQGMAIYTVIWWTILFAILPWGVRTQAESGEVVPGTMDSAPVRPLIWRKLLATTVVAAILYAGLHWLLYHSGMTLDNVPAFLKYEAAQ